MTRKNGIETLKKRAMLRELHDCLSDEYETLRRVCFVSEHDIRLSKVCSVILTMEKIEYHLRRTRYGDFSTEVSEYWKGRYDKLIKKYKT